LPAGAPFLGSGGGALAGAAALALGSTGAPAAPNPVPP